MFTRRKTDKIQRKLGNNTLENIKIKIEFAK